MTIVVSAATAVTAAAAAPAVNCCETHSEPEFHHVLYHHVPDGPCLDAFGLLAIDSIVKQIRPLQQNLRFTLVYMRDQQMLGLHLGLLAKAMRLSVYCKCRR